MRPFKLKSELVGDGLKIISLAEESFGRAHSKIWSDDFLSASWHMRHMFETCFLTLSYNSLDDHVGVKMDFDYIGDGLESHVRSDWWSEIWESFVGKVAKPWDSWTEDEIMAGTFSRTRERRPTASTPRWSC